MATQIPWLSRAKKIASSFEQLPESEAVALGGSRISEHTDDISDIDLYVFLDKDIDLSKRRKIAMKFGTQKQNIGLTFWDAGDEWIDKETGLEVDIMYWHKNWIESKLEDLFIKHQAELGYTTCFWSTILNLQILFDRTGWLEKFQNKYNQPFPRPLKEAIIAKNFPVLNDVIPSYYNQIKKAVARKDMVSINHRLAALLASYFDVLFAINELPHPGEKRMLTYAQKNCLKLPENMQDDITYIFEQSSFVSDRLPSAVKLLIDNLNHLLLKEKIL